MIPASLILFLYLNKMRPVREWRRIKKDWKVRLLHPVSDHQQNLHIRFIVIVEAWRINEDEPISIFRMIVYPDGLNLFRVWCQSRARTSARLISQGVYHLRKEVLDEKEGYKRLLSTLLFPAPVGPMNLEKWLYQQQSFFRRLEINSFENARNNNIISHNIDDIFYVFRIDRSNDWFHVSLLRSRDSFDVYKVKDQNNRVTWWLQRVVYRQPVHKLERPKAR